MGPSQMRLACLLKQVQNHLGLSPTYEDIQKEISSLEPRRGFSPDLTMSHPDLGLPVSRILRTKFLVYKSSSLCLWNFVIAALQVQWNKHACQTQPVCIILQPLKYINFFLFNIFFLLIKFNTYLLPRWNWTKQSTFD